MALAAVLSAAFFRGVQAQSPAVAEEPLTVAEEPYTEAVKQPA
jgi:hypothetical protein